MDGMLIIGAGVGMIAFAVLLFLSSVIYRITAGKKIRKELKREYE